MSTTASGRLGRRTYPFNHGRDAVITYPVTAAGVRTRVLEAGSGDDVLFCIHGAGSRADRFTPMIPALVSQGYHVFAIDLPGHGLADKNSGFAHDGPSMTTFVAEVIKTLGLRDVTVVGTSLGGHLAVWLALDHPDLVLSVVLVGTVGVNEFPAEFHTPVETVADGSPESVRRKLSFLVSDPAAISDAWVREESMINTSLGAKDALRSTAEYLNNGSTPDRCDARVRTERPDLAVVLVWGEDDRWTPLSMGFDARDNLPGSVLEVMPGCGHAPYFEDPDAFVAILSRHRDRLRS